jgi:hypothetical protein
MKHSPDQSLNEKLIPANENYQLTSQSMESFEKGSVLAQRDYTKPSKRSQLGLIVACGICALVLIVAFVVPLLK